jgi:hypothetical protein
LKISALLLCAACLSCYAQEGSPAGGNWFRTQQKNQATGADVTVFSVTAEEGDSDRRPSISIVCSGSGRPLRVTYFADADFVNELKDPLNFFTPALSARVKVDKVKIYRAIWDIMGNTKFAVLDRKTVKYLLSKTRLRVMFSAQVDQTFIDTFNIGGLELNQVREACGTKFAEEGMDPLPIRQ